MYILRLLIFCISQLYNTSKPYRFSKARCDACSEDLDRGQFLRKSRGRPNKQEGFQFRSSIGVSIFEERASKLIRKLPEISVTQLKNLKRYTQFSKSALSPLPNSFHAGDVNKFFFSRKKDSPGLSLGPCVAKSGKTFCFENIILKKLKRGCMEIPRFSAVPCFGFVSFLCFIFLFLYFFFFLFIRFQLRMHVLSYKQLHHWNYTIMQRRVYRKFMK